MADNDYRTKAFQKFYQEEDGNLQYMKSIKEREGMTPAEIAGTFDRWVERGTYESDTIGQLNYQGPHVTADMASRLYTTNREDVRIIDVAAGSGLLSIELRKYGFIQIDGVDPSPASEKKAMEAKLYGRYLVDFVNEQRLKIRTDEYDCAVSSGGFASGLMPCVALKEMIRIVKPGGYICFSVPSYIFTLCEEYRGRLEPLMDKYVSQGVWEKISHTTIDNYLDQRPGDVFVFKILKSEVLD